MIPTLLGNLERWLFEPPESIFGQPLWKLTRILRYPYGLIRDILRGDLTLRAMSLVYTTLLSVVPLLALSFAVLKGFGFHRELEPVLYTFLEPLGDRGYELTGQIMAFVDNVRGDVLGSLGLIFLLYTTISMIQKVEEIVQFRVAGRAAAQPGPALQRVSERHGGRSGGHHRGARPDRDVLAHHARCKHWRSTSRSARCWSRSGA